MNFLVTGNGHVANYIVKNLPIVHGQTIWHYTNRIQDLSIKELSSFIENNYKEFILINTAAKTNMSWCEQHPIECYENNVLASVELYKRFLEVTKNSKVYNKFIHISSGCLWQGPFKNDGSPFYTHDPVKPVCIYTKCKYHCEQELQWINQTKLIILRPRLVYSSENNERNLLMKILKYPKLINTLNTITSAETIVKTISSICYNQLNSYSGPINIYNPGVTTPYQIGVMLAKEGLRDYPELLSKEELDTWYNPPRADVVMFDSFFENLVKPTSVEEDLIPTIKQFKNNYIGGK